jgi:phosphoadenosine phosphosulfate reductase
VPAATGSPAASARATIGGVPADAKILVGVSGKDSLAVLDLLVASGREVVPFHMHLVPGLDVIECVLRWVETRYKLPVQRIQHWNTSNLLRLGLYRPHLRKPPPKLAQHHIEQFLHQKHGTSWTAYGYRYGDSLARAGMFKSWGGGVDKANAHVFPIWSWTADEMRAYLRVRRIPLPPRNPAGKSFGVDLGVDTLLWMRQHYPRDYRRILEVFPYAEAQLARREFQEARADQYPEVHDGAGGPLDDQGRPVQPAQD